jgi:hypothetical protein
VSFVRSRSLPCACAAPRLFTPAPNSKPEKVSPLPTHSNVVLNTSRSGAAAAFGSVFSLLYSEPVAAVPDVVPAFRWREEPKRRADQRQHLIEGTRTCRPEERFQFGERLFAQPGERRVRLRRDQRPEPILLACIHLTTKKSEFTVEVEWTITGGSLNPRVLRIFLDC